MNWAQGYSQAELEDAQARFGLVFPPDLVTLLRERRPVEGYDWNTENARIREMLGWPLGKLLWDVEHGLWWPAWGTRPGGPGERAEVVRHALSRAPKLIPLFAHRFLPETPHEASNPVFSMHGFDTIYYGANLAEYFENETHGRHVVGPVRYIPFWSDLVLADPSYEAVLEGC